MATLIPPETLLFYYRQGFFPMDSPEGGDGGLYYPDPRGVIFPSDFHIPHGARRTLADPAWECRVDTCFREVIAACALRPSTWISPRLQQSYTALHQYGHAHSVEIFREGRLVGGLYGVRLGAIFFGESMFHCLSGASKVALARLFEILKHGQFGLLEIQWVTPHLKLFGAREIPARVYQRLLNCLVKKEAKWPAPGPWLTTARGKPK